MHGDPENFMIVINVFMFKMHTIKIFKKLNHRNIVYLKKYIWRFNASLRAMYFKNKHGDPLFLYFIFISLHKMILFDMENNSLMIWKIILYTFLIVIQIEKG